MCHPVIRTPFEIEDVVAMVRRVYAGRVAFHDGAAEIMPGVTVHHIGGHSRGLQAVRVRTRRGWVVLASDVAHFYAHLDRRHPYPVIDSVPAMLEGFDTVERLASSRDHVVPGHDPIVQAIYPAARPGTEGWAVRLDADPRPRQS
jgi:glyoxylase-like metal-dependent hydrolase (beta-lactamase superfamily II)